MIKLERILVPTDFSEFSQPALLYGCAMAARFDAELHLLHVVPDPAMLIPELAQFSAESLQTQTNKLLDSAREQLNAMPGGDWVPSKPVVREVRIGPAFMEIVDYAEKQNIDLLVIGTHGRSGFMHLLMGSVAERVVRKSPCPVLTVKPEGHQFVEP
jgi:nucleotide-binding universal stress UspA family protein